MKRVRSLATFCELIGLAAALFPRGANQISLPPQRAAIVVVRNGKTPTPVQGKRMTLSLKHDLTLGEDNENPDNTFSVLNYFAVDDHGNIYVLDQKEGKVKIFAPSGLLVSTFGSKGQGPGEMQSPTGIGFDRTGNIYIHEFFGRRLQYFDRKGKWLKDTTFLPLDLGDIQMDSRGRIYSQSVTRDARTTKFELLKLDPGFHPLAVLATLAWPRAKLKNMASIGYPQIYFSVNRKDALIWAQSTEYQIHVLDAEGKPVRDIVRDSPPMEVTERYKAQFLRLLEDLDRKSSLRFPKSAYVFPKYFPAMQALFVDDQGRLYIRTYEKNAAEEILYDIFNEDGLFVSRFALPEREEAMAVKNGWLYAIIRDQAGGEYLLKRYLMTWRTELGPR
jgi:hypothetical protein